MTKVFERENGSASTPTLYRTQSISRRRRTSSCSSMTSSDHNTTSTPKLVSPYQKMARMPLTIIRKFSSTLHHTDSTSSTSKKAEERKKTSSSRSFLSRLHSSLSDSSLHTFTERKHRDIPSLPTKVLATIIDYSDPIQQQKMRAVNRTFRDYIDTKTDRITSLEVSKRPISTISRSDGWTKHRRANVAIRVSDDHSHVELVVDMKWTAVDIRILVGCMARFRKHVISATIDAPVAELLVASLSVVDLDRWYAFQCFMKALDIFNDDCHFPHQEPFVKPVEIYWPRLERLTVHTTTDQAPHLSRLIDYGVAASFVIDRCIIEELRIIVTDQTEDSNRAQVNKDIYHFRCWAGSAGFDDRFCVGPKALN